MKLLKHKWRIAGVLIVLCGSGSSQSQTQPQTISGYVLEEGTGQPISGAEISLVGNVGKKDDVSDSRGAFSIPLVHAVSKGDLIEIRVFKTGYKRHDEKWSVSDLAPKIMLEKEGGPKQPTRATLFSVEVTSTMNIPNQFWVVGPASTNDGVSPVDLIVIFNIINRQPMAAAISSFSMAIRTADGKWMALDRIQTMGTNLFPYWGPLNRAAKFNISPPDLERVLGPGANFGPGVTVRASGFFQFHDSRYCHPRNVPLIFRITLGDTNHHRVVIETKPVTVDPNGVGTGFDFAIKDPFKDLTGLKGAENKCAGGS